MTLLIVKRCQCLYFSVFIVASVAVNDRLDATWHARNQRLTVPLGDFGGPNVHDSSLSSLSVWWLFVCHLIHHCGRQVLNGIWIWAVPRPSRQREFVLLGEPAAILDRRQITPSCTKSVHLWISMCSFSFFCCTSTYLGPCIVVTGAL